MPMTVAYVPHGIDSALVTGVQGRGRVGRVGDVAINRVGHLVTKHRELIHLHASLVFSIDALVSEKTGGGNLVV